MGPSVVGVANSEIRAKAALTMGAPNALVECAGYSLFHQEPLSWARSGPCDPDEQLMESYFLALDLARHSGRVSILGFPGRAEPPPQRNPLDPSPFYSKQLTLLGAGSSPKVECAPEEIRFNLRRNLEYILDLMASKAAESFDL